jgi:hypothetical protein
MMVGNLTGHFARAGRFELTFTPDHSDERAIILKNVHI